MTVAMDAPVAAWYHTGWLSEESRGCRVEDVSSLKCGWDLTSYPPTAGVKQPDTRHIEVKGRVKGATTVTVTKNEIFNSWNQGKKYHLAIVLVGEDESIEGPHYVSHPFKEEPGCQRRTGPRRAGGGPDGFNPLAKAQRRMVARSRLRPRRRSSSQAAKL